MVRHIASKFLSSLAVVLSLTQFILNNNALALEPSIIEELQRMGRAFHDQEYTGTIIMISDKKFETLQVVHGVRNGIEHERVFRLNGNAREIVRDGHEINCQQPGEQLLTGRVSKSLIKHIGKLDDFYDFQFLEKGESQIDLSI
jgi:sigma-E factor negative regulatory protein RseB